MMVVVVVQVIDGVIRFRFNLGGQAGDTEVSLSSVHVSDGLWHSVHVERHGQWAVLSLDHGEGSFTNQTLPSSTGAGRVEFKMARRGLFAGGDVRFPSATSSPLVTHDFVDGESEMTESLVENFLQLFGTYFFTAYYILLVTVLSSDPWRIT